MSPPFFVLRAATLLAAILGFACSTDEPGGPGTTGSGGGPDCVAECGAENKEGEAAFGLLYACRQAECPLDCGTGASGGGGSSGGGGAGGSAPGGSGGAGAGGAGGAGGGSTGVCDGRGVCSDDDGSSKNDCTSCALAGPCADELLACQNSSACVAFTQCVLACPESG